jgi:hypothetical protein
MLVYPWTDYRMTKGEKGTLQVERRSLHRKEKIAVWEKDSWLKTALRLRCVLFFLPLVE